MGSQGFVGRTAAVRCPSTRVWGKYPLPPLTSGFANRYMTSPLESIVVALRREKLIPDALPPNFIPNLLFSIVYPTRCEVATGNTLLMEDTFEEPDIVISPMNLPLANADSTGEGEDFAKEVSYTLVMTDPDSPSVEDPKYRQFRHWLVRITRSIELRVRVLRIHL